MTERPLISIIFPAKNEGENIRITLDSLFSVKTNCSFETIVVNDGSTDNCCDFLSTYYQKDKVQLIETTGLGAANARNIGAENAAGDYLIFCDAHLEFEDGWMNHLVQPLLSGKTDVVTPAIGAIGNPEFTGYGQTLNSKLRTIWNVRQDELFETAIVPGGCFAIKRTVFEDVGGFENGFKTWGLEDVELSIKLWLFGYRCHVQTNVRVLHLFRQSHPYQVPHEDFYYNLLRMAYLHFTPVRISKCKKILRGNSDHIQKQVLHDGVLSKREQYFQKRKYDDDWYLKKFRIDF